jgi:hypothetical protein
MRLLHFSKNRRLQHVKFGNAESLQSDGTATISKSRVFASRKVTTGFICIGLISSVFAFAALHNQATTESNALRNASIQVPSSGTDNQPVGSSAAPNSASTVNVVSNVSQGNSSKDTSVGTNANVNIDSNSGNSTSAQMSVNGQTVSPPVDGSYVQTSVSPDQTTSVEVSNSHSNNSNSNGFNSSNENLFVNSYSDSQVQEGE